MLPSNSSAPSSAKAEEVEVVEEASPSLWSSFAKYLGVPPDTTQREEDVLKKM
jgi:translation initiation factor 6 (eIF-6)